MHRTSVNEYSSDGKLGIIVYFYRNSIRGNIMEIGLSLSGK